MNNINYKTDHAICLKIVGPTQYFLQVGTTAHLQLKENPCIPDVVFGKYMGISIIGGHLVMESPPQSNICPTVNRMW